MHACTSTRKVVILSNPLVCILSFSHLKLQTCSDRSKFGWSFFSALSQTHSKKQYRQASRSPASAWTRSMPAMKTGSIAPNIASRPTSSAKDINPRTNLLTSQPSAESSAICEPLSWKAASAIRSSTSESAGYLHPDHLSDPFITSSFHNPPLVTGT